MIEAVLAAGGIWRSEARRQWVRFVPSVSERVRGGSKNNSRSLSLFSTNLPRSTSQARSPTPLSHPFFSSSSHSHTHFLQTFFQETLAHFFFAKQKSAWVKTSTTSISANTCPSAARGLSGRPQEAFCPGLRFKTVKIFARAYSIFADSIQNHWKDVVVFLKWSK